MCHVDNGSISLEVGKRGGAIMYNSSKTLVVFMRSICVPAYPMFTHLHPVASNLLVKR